MARCSHRHLQVDERGEGLCSVPMWMDGIPAGFCDRPAYGERPPGRTWREAWTGEVRRVDGKYSGYVPGLACPVHGGPNSRVFMDGDKFCAVYANFVNLQESPAGFGDSTEDAQTALQKAGVA